jgi:hypothetical protein
MREIVTCEYCCTPMIVEASGGLTRVFATCDCLKKNGVVP